MKVEKKNIGILVTVCTGLADETISIESKPPATQGKTQFSTQVGQQAVRDFDSQVRLPLGRHASCTCGAQAKKAFRLSVHTPHISSKTKHRL
jgi:hypothetical protein